MADLLKIGPIEYAGPPAGFDRLRRSIEQALASADHAEFAGLRVIITDGPVAVDQVDDVIDALNRQSRKK